MYQFFELDLTKPSLSGLAPWIPSGFWVTLFCGAVLAVLAWSFAWRCVRRSEKEGDLELFVAFPITHLFFMPLFAWRDFRQARASLAISFCVIPTWLLGGYLTELKETSDLHHSILLMETKGEFLSLPNEKDEFDENDKSNIWAHPYLQPLVQMTEVVKSGMRDRGFLLRMESGHAADKLSRDKPFHWYVSSEIPVLPHFEESSKTGNAPSNGGGPAISAEMMQRYGLTPMNSPSNVPVEKQQPSLEIRYLTNNVFVGGEPNGSDAFAVLKGQGIKTIVSVDGATPNVELARQYGMQYVHIPIGYDGIDSQATLSLVRVARAFKRPIYLHCHHGQHRGPAAAAVLCIADGALTNEAAQIFMQQAGTSRDYAGLWRDVAQFRPPSDDVDLPELVEVAPVGDMAATMAKMDRAFDRLKSSREMGWSIPEGDPDLVPAQLALIMREWFHELGRQPLTGQHEGMKTGLQRAEDLVADLEAALHGDEVDKASDALQQLKQACVDCHTSFRN